MSYNPNAGGGNFVDHFARWMQLRAMMDDLKYRKERREQDRQLFQMELEDRNRKRAHEDFTTHLALQNIGALPAAPGDTGQNDEAIAQAVNITPENRRRLVNTPVGSYRLPSETDRFNRAKTQATQTGVIKGLEKKATDEITEPTEDLALPDILGGGTATVKKTDKVTKLLDIYKTAHPHRTYHATTPNDQGDITIWSVDPANGDIRTEKTLTKAGKSKTIPQGAESIPDFDAQVKGLMDAWRPGHYNQLGITPDVVEAAKGQGETDAFGASSNPAATRIQQAENTLYQRAVDSLKNQAKGNRTTSSARTGGGPVLPKANVTKAAQRKGMTVAEFTRWFTEQGGVIQ